jgi:hypothetical protein
MFVLHHSQIQKKRSHQVGTVKQQSICMTRIQSSRDEKYLPVNGGNASPDILICSGFVVKSMDCTVLS